MIGRTLADKISEEELSELRTIVDRMEEVAAHEEVDTYSELNFSFTTGSGSLPAMPNSPVCTGSCEGTHPVRPADPRGERDGKVSLSEYREILEMIASRNTAAVGRAIFAPIMASRERMHESGGLSADEPTTTTQLEEV